MLEHKQMKKHLIAFTISVGICILISNFTGSEGRYDPSGSIMGSLLYALLSVPFFGVLPYAIAGVPIHIYQWPEWTRLITVACVFFFFALGMSGEDMNGASGNEQLVGILVLTFQMWAVSLVYGIPLVLVIYYLRRRLLSGTDEKPDICINNQSNQRDVLTG